jgi:hypothetical protein
VDLAAAQTSQRTNKHGRRKGAGSVGRTEADVRKVNGAVFRGGEHPQGQKAESDNSHIRSLGPI